MNFSTQLFGFVRQKVRSRSIKPIKKHGRIPRGDAPDGDEPGKECQDGQS